jgi:aspartate kinase
VIDDHPEKVQSLALQAADLFDVNLIRGLTLLTVRHYNDNILSELCRDRKTVLKQQTPETVQVVLQDWFG